MAALLTRRSLLGGIGALLAAPAIVRAASLMPVKAFVENPFNPDAFMLEGTWTGYDGSFIINRASNPWWNTAHYLNGETKQVRDYGPEPEPEPEYDW